MLTERRAHTTLPVSDPEGARAFWEGRLGFVPYEENPAAVMYRAGEGSVFALTRSTGRATGAHTQIGFTVDDIDAEVRELRERGVVFEEYDLPGFRTIDGVAQTGAGRAAWFRDPEGNLVGLIQFA